jgi:hypothetical protein
VRPKLEVTTMLNKTLLISPFVASCLLLSGHAAEASEPEFGTVTVGPPFLGASDPSKPGSTQPTVHVAMENDAWTSVVPGDLALPIAYKAHMKKGYIIDFKFGRPHGLGGDQVDPIVPPLGEPNPNMAARDVAGAFAKQIGTARLLPGEQAEIVAACTSQANETNGFEATYNFLIAFEVDAKRRRRWGIGAEGWVPFGDSARKVVIGFIPIRIICEPPPTHIAIPPVPFKVTGAELYLATFKGDSNIPSQGTACKVLRVTARFKTTTSGLVHFDLSRKVGDQALATIPITLEAKKKPDGTYAAEYVKDWFLDKTTYAQFFVQETDGQGVSAGWKDINVTCDNNLADPTSQPPSDEPALKVLKSKFTVTTFQNDSATGCPVNAALDVEFITNKPGGVPFKVTGTDGFVWNFSIKADQEFGPLQIGEGQAQFAKTFRATHRRMIQVTKSTDAQYSLEVRNVAAEPSAKTAGPDNLKVRCGGDLTVPLAVTGTELNIVGLPGCPTTAFAAATFVTNGPGNVRYRLAATTGQVETGTAEAKKVGNRFVATAKLSAPITKGGEVIFSATPLDFPKKLALKKKQYNCGGAKPSDVTGGTGLKPRLDPKKVIIDLPKVTEPPKPIDPPKKKVVPVIVTPKPLSCAGGVVKNTKCVCPTGLKAVKAAPNAFRCVQTAPSVLNLPKAAKPKASLQKLRSLQ